MINDNHKLIILIKKIEIIRTLISAGFEFRGEFYPDMFYANINPTGMMNIAKCVSNIRSLQRKHQQTMALQNHQLLLVQYKC